MRHMRRTRTMGGDELYEDASEAFGPESVFEEDEGFQEEVDPEDDWHA